MTVVSYLVAALVFAAVLIYNRLVRDRNRVDGAWSDIDVQLQRRHDLVPQLVEAVSQYAKYEKATIEAVTALRAEALGTDSVGRLGEVEAGLSEELVRLIAVAEAYPDLKASENFLNLQEQLAETEDYLQFARRYYNGSVREFNTRTETVPSNVVAKAFGFSQREYFQKESDDVANVPLVDLDRAE